MKIIEIEKQLNSNIDLLEIAKDYCEFNIDKSIFASRLLSMLEIILINQKKISIDLDRYDLK